MLVSSSTESNGIDLKQNLTAIHRIKEIKIHPRIQLRKNQDGIPNMYEYSFGGLAPNKKVVATHQIKKRRYSARVSADSYFDCAKSVES